MASSDESTQYIVGPALDADRLLRTDVRDQRRPDWTRRGSKYWTQAEIRPDIMYVVGGFFSGSPNSASAARFITSDLREALSIPGEQGLEEVDILVFAWGGNLDHLLESIYQTCDEEKVQLAPKILSVTDDRVLMSLVPKSAP